MVDAYYSDFKNKQVSGTDTNTSQSVYTTLDKVAMRGVNGEFSYKFDDRWNLYASYAYTEAQMKQDLSVGGSTYATDGKTLINTPRHVGSVALNYGDGPLWASLKLNARSGIWADWENTAKAGGYTVINLDGGWNFQDLGWLKKPYLKLNVWNLDNRKAFTYASSVTTYRSSGDDTWYLLQDRTFIVTVGASFDL